MRLLGKDSVLDRRTNLDKSFVDTLMPLHNNIIRPVNATAARNLTFVRDTINALHGGNLAFADFHVTPPFGSNISDRRKAGSELVKPKARDVQNPCEELKRYFASRRGQTSVES